MKVEVLYTSKSKHVKPVAEEMARWVKTYAKNINDYSPNGVVDLMVITFDDTVFKDKELCAFIKKLDRRTVKNLALVNAFYMSDKKMQMTIKLCQEVDLPLMREQYSWKITLRQWHHSEQGIVDGARLYIEDMVNIVRNYY